MVDNINRDCCRLLNVSIHIFYRLRIGGVSMILQPADIRPAAKKHPKLDGKATAFLLEKMPRTCSQQKSTARFKMVFTSYSPLPKKKVPRSKRKGHLRKRVRPRGPSV